MKSWFLLLALPLYAQQQAAQPPLALTLTQAEQLALQNNPQISAAANSAAASHQIPLELHAAQLPSLTGAVTGVGADSGSRLAAGGLNNPVVYNRLGTGLIANQLITDFGRTKDLVGSANLRAQAQDQLTETAKANILIATASSYFAVLRAQALLKVAQETVSARQLVSDQVTALANSNLKSGLDVSFANVNLADAKLFLAQTQNEVTGTQAQLAAAMGLTTETSFALAEEMLPEALPDQPAALIQQALQARPELKDFRLQQSAAQQQAKAEHALRYPTVAVAAAAGFVPAGESNVPGRYGAVGLNLSIPILNGGLFRARQTEAELNAKAAGDRVNDLVNRVTRDVRLAYLNSSTAFQRLGLTAQLLSQAQLAMDLARGRYDLGLSSIVELSQAQLNLTSAQIANTTARYDYQSQRQLLDYQVGVLR